MSRSGSGSAAFVEASHSGSAEYAHVAPVEIGRPLEGGGFDPFVPRVGFEAVLEGTDRDERR